MEGVRSLTVLQTHCHVSKHVDLTSVLLLFVAAASRGMEGCVVTEHHHAGVSTRAAPTGRGQVRARSAEDSELGLGASILLALYHQAAYIVYTSDVFAHYIILLLNHVRVYT